MGSAVPVFGYGLAWGVHNQHIPLPSTVLYLGEPVATKVDASQFVFIILIGIMLVGFIPSYSKFSWLP